MPYEETEPNLISCQFKCHCGYVGSLYRSTTAMARERLGHMGAGCDRFRAARERERRRRMVETWDVEEEIVLR